MTMVTTKIEPMTMPGFDSGTTTFHSVCQPEAPGVVGGLEQRAVDAAHRVEDGHDHEHRVEVHEGQHHRRRRRRAATRAARASARVACRNELTSPLRPSSGTQEIMRMTFEVQNGMVHTRKSTICPVSERTWKARK